MDYKEERELVDAMLADWPLAKRAGVSLSYRNRKVTACCTLDDGRTAKGVARCHPLDTYDARSGALYALANLRVRCAYKESGLARKMKTWVPADGGIYFLPSFDDLAPEQGKAGYMMRHWHGSAGDVMYLSLGLVFRTPVEARKAARRFLFEGRALVNFARKRDSLDRKKMLQAVGPVARDGFVPDDEDIFAARPALDIGEEDQEVFPPAPDEEEGMAPLPDREDLSRIVVAPVEEAEAEDEPGEEAHADPHGDMFFELPDEAYLSSMNLKSGEHYTMNPLTGEICLVGGEGK